MAVVESIAPGAVLQGARATLARWRKGVRAATQGERKRWKTEMNRRRAIALGQIPPQQ